MKRTLRTPFLIVNPKAYIYGEEALELGMICEPTGLIGTGRTSNDDYINATNAAIKSVSTEIRIIQAAGVSTGSDVYHVIMQGAHGSGGTSGILNAPSRKGKIIEMLDALVKAKKDLV